MNSPKFFGVADKGASNLACACIQRFRNCYFCVFAAKCVNKYPVSNAVFVQILLAAND